MIMLNLLFFKKDESLFMKQVSKCIGVMLFVLSFSIPATADTVLFNDFSQWSYSVNSNASYTIGSAGGSLTATASPDGELEVSIVLDVNAWDNYSVFVPFDSYWHGEGTLGNWAELELVFSNTSVTYACGMSRSSDTEGPVGGEYISEWFESEYEMAIPPSWVFADTGEGGGVILDVSSGVLGATVMDDIIYSWYSTDTNLDNVVVISWLQMTNLTGPYDLTVNLSYVSDGAVDGGITFSNLQYGQTVSASFSANPTIGNPPLSVNFSDESTGTITSWNWNFGDGASSAIQNPSHIYTDEGKYSVSLIVSGPYGSDTATKTDYISIAKNTNGDINNDNVIDLKDALICLMAVSGDTSNAINLGGDVNGDGKIGMEEVLYILRTIINDGEPNQLLFAQFDQLSIASPEEISPLKCEGVIYDPWGYKLSEYTKMKLNTDSNSAPYSINLIPNGNPSTTESGIVSSAIVNKLLDVSAYNSVIISFWANSTSNPRINSIHNCDSGLNIRYRIDGGAWQHFCCYCGQHKTETSGWRYMDISGCPILTENASTIEFAFEYYIQNSNGDSSVYYLIDNFKVTGVE